jgi:hypothetical protein
MKRPEVLAQWKQVVHPEKKTVDFTVCDIHFTPEDFYPYVRSTNYPAYLQGLKKNPIAVPSLYLDKDKNVAARVIAKAINEPDWWKLIVVVDSNDTRFSENESNTAATEGRLHTSQPCRVATNIDLNTSSVSMQNQEQNKTVHNSDSHFNASRQTTSDFEQGFSAIYTFPYNQRLPPQPVLLSVKKKISQQTKCAHDVCVTLESIEQEQFESDSPMQDDHYSHSLDSKDEDSDIEIIEPKVENVSEIVVIKPKPLVEVQRDTVLTVEEMEISKKKLHLFRMMCTSIIQLPSPQWAVHPNYDSKNVVICKVLHTSDGFEVERGVCFNANMVWPDIRINGQKVLIDSSELTCIADVERLVKKVDMYVQ